VFFIGTGGINANIFVSPGFGSGTTSNSSLVAEFRIRRVGNTIFEEFDTGGGFVTLHSATGASLGSPAQIEIFLIEEFGVAGPHQAVFDNLQITADVFSENFIPPAQPVAAPSALLLLVAGLGGTAALRRILAGSRTPA
jgi:hypothetical protein